MLVLQLRARRKRPPGLFFFIRVSQSIFLFLEGSYDT